MKSRQAEVYEWALGAFGTVASDPHERAMRFVEEALEVGQATGISLKDLEGLINRAYNRPVSGHPCREMAQAQLTLETLAERWGHDLSVAADEEFARLKSLPREFWQERQASKAREGVALHPADVCRVTFQQLREFAAKHDGCCKVVKVDGLTQLLSPDDELSRRLSLWYYFMSDEPESFPYEKFGIERPT